MAFEVEIIKIEKIISIEEILKKGSIDEKKGFHFENVSSDEMEVFFKNGMSPSSYRIGHHENKKNHHEYFVTFFNMSTNPDKHNWVKIHTHASMEAATEKLGKLVAHVKKMNIASEGFHLIEHVLLRDDKPHQISVVLPLWPARFQDIGFQKYVQQLFARQAPLYVVLDFLWLDIAKMEEFELVYFPWLKSLETGNITVGNKNGDGVIKFLKENSKIEKEKARKEKAEKEKAEKEKN